MDNLLKFCNNYDLDISKIRHNYLGQAPVIIEPSSEEFSGRPDAIRVTTYGRFGNNLFSFINALIIASKLNINAMEISPMNFNEINFPLILNSMTVDKKLEPTLARSAIVGPFYAPIGFESLVGDYTTEELDNIITGYVRNIYRSLMSKSGSLGKEVALLHFRAGDIFDRKTQPHSCYVQPPVAYYSKAISNLIYKYNIKSVHLVFEDLSNPAIELVKSEVIRLGLDLTQQSATLSEDLISILSAHHLVAPYGTFCEAAAMLSRVLESFTGFRSLSSSPGVSYWSQTRINDVLEKRNVRRFIIDDPDKTYIAPNTWQNTDEQLALICDYAKEKLRIIEQLNYS